MNKCQDSREIAQLFLQVIPLMGRMFSAQLRQAGHNLAPGHFRLLMLLSGQPRNVSELAAMQRVSVPTMSNSVSILVERGWAERVRDMADRRRVVIDLTEQGRDVLRMIHDQLEAGLVSFCETLTPQECESFHTSLRAMVTVMQRAAERAGVGSDLPSFICPNKCDPA